MQIPIGVVTGGKRWRNRIATMERGATVARKYDRGLALDEVKRLTEHWK